MQLGVILGLLFGFVIAFFAVLNTETVTISYYFGSLEASVALLVLASAALGAITVGLLGFVKHIRTGFTLWDYRNKLQRLSKEVEGLKQEKKALSDDLSFLNAECEQVVRKKEAQLEECREEPEPSKPQETEDTENNEDTEERAFDGL
ncbi:MAG: DUF1049 domain-containing protein [Clostridiales bacterium]|jgi:uncharacterized integral membrane protein|nr:DUF1049 domain-containing protein [Clostridiales bacterium]